MCRFSLLATWQTDEKDDAWKLAKVGVIGTTRFLLGNSKEINVLV